MLQSPRGRGRLRSSRRLALDSAPVVGTCGLDDLAMTAEQVIAEFEDSRIGHARLTLSSMPLSSPQTGPCVYGWKAHRSVRGVPWRLSRYRTIIGHAAPS